VNTSPTIIISVLIVIGMLLSACAPAGSPVDFKGTSWKLVSYGPVGDQTPAAPGIGTRLDFGEDGQVSGILGCNSFSGSYSLKAGKMVFSSLASTLMACPEPQMTQEIMAFQVLQGTVRFEQQGSRLTIFSAREDNALTLSK
jgi:heat shock protein HslJ